MNLTNIEKDKILFAIDLLNGIDNDKYKIKSINMVDNCVVFSNGINDVFKMFNDFNDSNDDKYINKETNNQETNNQEANNKKTDGLKEMNGGKKNIFQKIKYSDTSSLNIDEIKNENKYNSLTSSVFFNEKSSKYSDTFATKQNGGKYNNFTSDTLMDLSEIKNRKNVSTNLDVDIFKKVQSGGSIDVNIKKKMKDIGINSSTSSICE